MSLNVIELQTKINALETENKEMKMQLSNCKAHFLLTLQKFKGGVHYSPTHSEFRTTFTGDWNDIEQAATINIEHKQS